MKRVGMLGLSILVMAGLLAAQSQKKPEKKQDSFWTRILRIAGVSATPASLRGEDRVACGDVWWTTAGQDPVAHRLTNGGGYCSPVFDSSGQNILALKSGKLYRIPLDGKPSIELQSLGGVTKLVGINRDDPDELLVVGRDAEHLPFAAIVSVKTGSINRVPYDPNSSEDKVMLAHLSGWERVYGNTRVYTEATETEGPGGITTKFTDVYLKHGSDEPINLTSGNNVSSSQPSLSPDGQRVVFIRSQR
jgi:hypothetical protein